MNSQLIEAVALPTGAKERWSSVTNGYALNYTAGFLYLAKNSITFFTIEMKNMCFLWPSVSWRNPQIVTLEQHSPAQETADSLFLRNEKRKKKYLLLLHGLMVSADRFIPFLCQMWVLTSRSFSFRFCDLVNSLTEEAWKGSEEGDCDSDSLEVTHSDWRLTLCLIWSEEPKSL